MDTMRPEGRSILHDVYEKHLQELHRMSLTLSHKAPSAGIQRMPAITVICPACPVRESHRDGEQATIVALALDEHSFPELYRGRCVVCGAMIHTQIDTGWKATTTWDDSPPADAYRITPADAQVTIRPDAAVAEPLTWEHYRAVTLAHDVFDSLVRGEPLPRFSDRACTTKPLRELALVMARALKGVPDPAA